MAFNGSGTFVRLYSWVTDAANSVNITASRMDGEDTGFASGLTNCITRDGQSPALANIPLGGFKITGLANGVAATDAAAYGQITSGGTYTGKIITLASAAVTGAGFNVPAGVVPTTPVDGDMWSTTAAFFVRVNGVTGQVSLTGATETLLGKTMTSPVLNTPAVNGGTVTPAAAPTATGPGFLGVPQNNQTANYTLVMADIGKEIYLSGTTAGQTLTIPANGSVAYPIGAVIVLTNDTNQVWSIAITTDTLAWSPTLATGTRTFAVGGQVTVSKKTAIRWWISGTGLT